MRAPYILILSIKYNFGNKIVLLCLFKKDCVVVFSVIYKGGSGLSIVVEQIFLSNYLIILNLIRSYIKSSCSNSSKTKVVATKIIKKIIYFSFVENELKLYHY